MPIYEFYCVDCNTLYNFFSSRIDTTKKPDCPRCGREQLERRPARFATVRRDSHQDGGEPLDALDDEALEQAMAGMAQELEGMGDGEDPKQLAHALRRMGQSSGLELGPKMEELLGRLESGAPLEDLEAEMAALDESADPEDENFEDYFRLKKSLADHRKRRPRLDNELYFL